MKKVVLLSLLCCSLFSCNKEQVSPNGKITLTYSNENQSHSFHLTYTDAQGKHDVLNLPAIGLLTADGGGKNLELKSISDAQAIHDEYIMLTGKREQCSNDANEYTYSFKDSLDRELRMVFLMEAAGSPTKSIPTICPLLFVNGA